MPHLLCLDARGEATVTLPDTIAYYRVTARANMTFSLPIVVRR